MICVKVEISRVLEKLAGSMNVGLTKMTPPFDGIDHFDYGLRRALDAEFDWPGFGRQLLDQVPEKTLVFAQGVFELRFAFFLPPDEPDTLYCFGPWADGPRSKESLDWCEKYLDEKARNVVEEYYNRARQMEDNAIKTSLFAVISLLFPEGELKTAEWAGVHAAAFPAQPGELPGKGVHRGAARRTDRRALRRREPDAGGGHQRGRRGGADGV